MSFFAPREVISVVSSIIDEAAFPLLVVISTANLDGITCSASWALVNLLKSVDRIESITSVPSSSWLRRLMFIEYVVEVRNIL